MVWQPDHSRAIIKREELRQARERDETEGLEHALDLDADEVAARAERKRLEREAAGDAPEPRERPR
jgi:hypothetical protein